MNKSTSSDETADKNQLEKDHIPVGFLSHDFGLLLPSDTGFSIRKQTGGVCCHQIELSGQYLPLKRPHLRQGYPDWLPASNGVGPDEKHPVTDVDLEAEIPARDYESLPDWVRDRDPSHFHNWEEFMYWLESDDVWWYWTLDLIEELRKWNYDPTGDITDRDMGEKWDRLDDIWAAIDKRLRFTYKEIDVHQRRRKAIQNDEEPALPLNPETYPTPCEGVKWIRITGSTYYEGRPQSPWAEAIAGEHALLLYPNSD